MELNPYLIYAQLGLDLLLLLAILILARRLKGLSSEVTGQGRFPALLKEHERGLLKGADHVGRAGTEACSRSGSGHEGQERQRDLKRIAHMACELADKGRSLEEIAYELGMSLSEVELLLCLNRQGTGYGSGPGSGSEYESGSGPRSDQI